MSEANETGIYIFCGIQTNEEASFGLVELEGEKREIFTIHYKDAAMVASEVPMKIYHPNKENLMMHQNTVSAVMAKNDTVIPISFGNIFKSKEDVHVILKNLYPQFENIFPEIKGKIELGLKVIGKNEWLESRVRSNPDVAAMSEKVRGKSEAAGYYDRIKLGSAAQSMFAVIQDEVTSGVYEPLAEMTDAAKTNEPKTETTLLNASFLIDRNQEESFDEMVNKQHEKWKDKVDFKYSGPWPAYNFVNIRLSVEEA